MYIYTYVLSHMGMVNTEGPADHSFGSANTTIQNNDELVPFTLEICVFPSSIRYVGGFNLPKANRSLDIIQLRQSASCERNSSKTLQRCVNCL